jgi:hypothetical protein
MMEDGNYEAGASLLFIRAALLGEERKKERKEGREEASQLRKHEDTWHSVALVLLEGTRPLTRC